MDRAFNKWLWFAVGLVIALLVFNGAVTFQAMRSLGEESRLMGQRYQFLEASDDLGLQLEKVELGASDLLSGRNGLADKNGGKSEDFTALTRSVDLQLQRVMESSRGLTHLPDQLTILHGRIRIWLNSLNGMVTTSGVFPHPAVRAAAITADRKEYGQIRSQLDVLESQQQHLLRAHQEALGSTIHSAVRTALATSFLAILAIGASGYSLRRHLLTCKTAEDLLRGDREWFCSTLGSIGAGVIATDTHGQVKFMNAVGEKLTGFSAQEACGEFLGDVFRTYAIGSVASSPCPVDPAVEESGTDLALFSQDGRQRTVSASRTLIRDSRGKPYGSVLVFGDVTQKRQYEAELQEQRRLLEISKDTLEVRVKERTAELAQANAELELARDAAEAGNRSKSLFLANMSHEIRTPLNAIIGMTELALKEQLTPQQREYLNTVRDAGESLLTVIDDILDFSKIEAGRIVLQAEPFNLRESLGDTLKAFALRAGQKGIELVFRIDQDVPRMLIGDYNRLRQIIVNLVANAIKFTAVGEVLVEARTEPADAGQCVVHLLVKDSGIGIPYDRQSAIFNIFEQGDSTTTRRYGGTGLGLAIASRLVELMGGNIWVESEEGAGSTFHFTAAFGAVDSRSDASPDPHVGLSGVSAIVVDDNESVRDTLCEMLAGWSMRVHGFDSAVAAVEFCVAANSRGFPVCVALIDGSLPGVDAFLQTLADEAGIAVQRLVILLSPGRPSAPATACAPPIPSLLKPVKESEIRDAVLRALGLPANNPSVQPSSTAVASRLEPLRILLAEDSQVNRKLALALLSGEGHDVSVACTGAEAVEACQHQSFDLILMDVQMPEMDGLEATALLRLRERETLQHTPIIAMTAHALKGDRERCLAAGMDGYVAKPIRADDLFASIAATLASVRRVRPPASVPAEHTEAHADAPADEADADEDAAEVLRACSKNEKLIGPVAQAAVEEVPRLLDEIHTALEGGDPTRLRLSAHTLKGSLSYFGRTRAYATACQMEEMGKKGAMDSARTIYETLDATTRHVASLLAELVSREMMHGPP